MPNPMQSLIGANAGMLPGNLFDQGVQFQKMFENIFDNLVTLPA